MASSNLPTSKLDRFVQLRRLNIFFAREIALRIEKFIPAPPAERELLTTGVGCV